ncbi:hypothetical protein [Chelatococcus asaccharovorans]|uniref:AAA domain-containing protein n=1 Tax=Chelatococcus asaccharovorans TaxID=28210 RepID=A0A2V3U4X9_9HYPH|nr:hypothetical protein [Chelatococcus asaccharovorans]MBS7706112.1 hypothetical protein [Chelatococcus asaccharovorans]PXW52482.1 hypothetical protein C7450_11656 [Chelatococcus asaccharovorans]
MKSLKLRRLSLLSKKERKGRIEKFDDGSNVVIGENDTGKSCLIKSIYGALAAPATKINPRWNSIDPIARLDFSVDADDYTIVQHGKFIALFDADARMLWCHTAVTAQIGPKIAELLDFGIRLATKQQTVVVPPPAFSFMPFYVDQDTGWQSSWISFAGVQMIPNYKRDIVEFHTGIRPKEFYAAKIVRDEALRKQADLVAEQRALARAARRLQDRRRPVGLDFRPEVFEDHITELTEEVTHLEEGHSQIRRELSALQSRKAVLVEEVSVARSALSDLEADYRYATKLEGEVICPTCGTEHENDFAAKFGLLADAEMCRTIITDSSAELERISVHTKDTVARLGEFQMQIGRINGLLEETRGDIKLRDMLEDESERILDVTIKDEDRALIEAIGQAAHEIDEANERMGSFERHGRRAQIEEFFGERLREFAEELKVSNAVSGITPRVDMTIRDTGSDLPRAQLAYYYAILHTVAKYSTACMCPIILDTPLQQDQDDENARRMIRFAIERRPKDTQLVLGTVKLHGVVYDGHRIVTVDKDSLLQASSYDEARAEIDPLVDQMFGQGSLGF